MTKTLLNIHLYLGLIFGPYFVIYGLTAIAFNHEWPLVSAITTTEHRLVLPVGPDDRQLALVARDSLGIWGHVSQSQIRRNSEGHLGFLVSRPGRTYLAVLDTETGHITVREENTGFWGVIYELHGMRGFEGSYWATSWRIYSEASIWALIYAALSGVYCWWARATERRAGWWALGLGTVCSALMMLYMVV